jgi:hypothetical protein
VTKSLLQQLDEEFGVGLGSGQDERRSSLRRPCVAPAILVPDGDEAGRRDGIALDVSETGIRVLSRAHLEAEVLEVRIPRAEGEPIVLVGRVVRTRELGSGYREYGLRFLAEIT